MAENNPLANRMRPKELKDFVGQELDYGKGYKYTPLEDSSDQEYLPEKLKGRKYFKNDK